MSKGTCPLFKLILGLGNKDIDTSYKIAKNYANFGIDIIDMSAYLFSKLTDKYKLELKQNNPNLKFCVSVALFGDIHNKKAKINDNCKKCLKCHKKCSQNAIEEKDGILRVSYDKCTGCQNCKKVCNNNAIDIYEQNLLADDIEQIRNNKPDILEVHLSIKKKKEILKYFENIMKIYNGDTSICLSRKFLSSQKAIKIIKQLYEIFLKYNNGFIFYVQADGSSINNASLEYSSNLEALAFYNEISQSIKNLKNIKTIISGGLNNKTVELCKLFNLKPDILAFGSYARKLFNEDVNKAKELVLSVKEFYEHK